MSFFVKNFWFIGVVQHLYFCMYSVNEIIRNRSDATAATFIYLPAPPRLDSPNWTQTSVQYLDLLTELTTELPPTVLVHGVSAVTSINL